jgi:hypothetical protein
VILAADLEHWAVGVETVEQDHDGQARELRFELVRHMFEGPKLAVLLVVVGVTLGVVEELAHQQRAQPIGKGEARLKVSNPTYISQLNPG